MLSLVCTLGKRGVLSAQCGSGVSWLFPGMVFFRVRCSLLLKAAGPGKVHLCSRAQRSSLSQMATVSSERSELHKHLRQTRRLRQRAAKRYREQWNADHLKPEANMDHVTVIDFNHTQVKSLELTPTAARLEETRIDDDDSLEDGYEQHQDTCAELRCMEVLFESRLQLSRVANKRLQELITTWRAGILMVATPSKASLAGLRRSWTID